jgi:hypothetical protein
MGESRLNCPCTQLLTLTLTTREGQEVSCNRQNHTLPTMAEPAGPVSPFMPSMLVGKVALVTGGTSGIGLEIATQLGGGPHDKSGSTSASCSPRPAHAQDCTGLRWQSLGGARRYWIQLVRP